MVTFGVLKAQIGRLVSDADNVRYDDAVIRDCVNDALRALALHTGAASVSQIIPVEGVTTYPLPENCTQDGVFAARVPSSTTWLTHIDYFPGESIELKRGYTLWPSGYITLNFVPTTVVDYYYVAHYDEILGDADVIAIPRWAIEPVKLYAASRVLSMPASKAALLGQYKRRTDAGSPTDNPLLDMAKYYMSEYRRLLNETPKPQYKKLPPPVLGGRA